MFEEILEKSKSPKVRRKEGILLPIKIGDEILVGRFKNKRITVNKIGTDDHGQPTVNGRPILNCRIDRLVPKPKVNKEK